MHEIFAKELWAIMRRRPELFTSGVGAKELHAMHTARRAGFAAIRYEQVKSEQQAYEAILSSPQQPPPLNFRLTK